MQGITTLFEERSLLLIVLNNLLKNHKSYVSQMYHQESKFFAI